MRATNSFYREQIQMSDFNFYFTKASTLPAIVDHVLTNYGNIPLGVHFKKSIERELSPYVDHIWRLSNLTALSFDFLPLYIRVTDGLWKLTQLTKLTVFPNCPFGKFFNMRSLNVSMSSNDELQRMPNIEEFVYSRYLGQRVEEPYDFMPNPDRVTRIVLYHDIFYLNRLNRFTNLQKLQFTDVQYNFQNQIGLSKLTSIRDLVINGPNYYGCYNMTNLTALHIGHVTSEISQVSALYNLKKLTVEEIRWQQVTHPFELDLAPLTALQALYCKKFITTRDLFDAATLPHLTALQMSVHPAVRIAHLTSLHHSLKTLCMIETDVQQCHVDYSALSHLTNLVSLDIRVVTSRPSLTSVGNLTNLTNLEVYRYVSTFRLVADWSLSKLTNLEVLRIGSAPTTILDDLSHATKLTNLEMRLTAKQLAQNSTCLASLVNLKCLALPTEMNDFLFWRSLTKLTALESLELCHVDSDEKIASLTALIKLTRLEVTESKRLSGLYLHYLTTLQVLKFASRYARAQGMKKKGLRKFAEKMPHLYSYSFH